MKEASQKSLSGEEEEEEEEEEVVLRDNAE